MKEVNFYKYAAILLLVINIGTLAFFFTRKPPHHRPHPDKEGMTKHEAKLQERAAEMLNLDEAQKVEFIALATAHHQQMIAINEKQKRLLDNGFEGIMDSTKIEIFSQDLAQLETLEGEKIAGTFEHFREIKSILKVEQLPDFEQFLKGAKQHLLGGGKGKKK